MPSKVKYLCNGSPRFKSGTETFQARPGFNEMPAGFTKDPYYPMCVKSGIIKDFVATPTDKQQEAFDAQLKAERAKREAAEKELADLKRQIAKSAEQTAKSDKK